MRSLITAGLLALNAQAFTLPELLEGAQNNEQVQAYVDRSDAARFERKAAFDSYLPRIDVGGSASFIDEQGTLDPGETYKAYAEANFVVLDGFRRENMLREKKRNEAASRFEVAAYKKALSLQVIELYFGLDNVLADIEALKRDREQLNEQLERLRLFYGAGIATEEDVERLNAAVANADYAIASQQFEADSLRSRLELLGGRPLVGAPEPQQIVLPQQPAAKALDRLRALSNRAEALGYVAEQADADYYPTLSLNDTYTFYDYQNFDPGFPVNFVDKQNRLTVTLRLNLIDFSAASEARQALLLQQHALQQELAFEANSVEAQRRLALKAIERAKALLEAAEKSKAASDRTFEVVKQKYEARIVDYIRYLDALSKATEAQAQHNRAKSGLNTAYASYIYYLGEDPKEFVR